jgi:UDP-N-acetylmuramoyl-tripeptide--D-alanyl-D-alanine ligase
LFTIDDILLATGGVIIGSGADRVFGVTTDSRAAQSGELFVALRGERFDGHDYLDAATACGVRVFLVADDWAASRKPSADCLWIAVADTLRGLGDLAAFHRRRFSIPVAGITGSNGKTTTKEMLAAILDLTGPGLKTIGNLNNLIGLPRMLLQLTAEHRWGALEMGMSEPGEIDRLAEIAGPRGGVITNAHPAHLESMGSVEAVARAKGELFLRLTSGGCAVYNADDSLVARSPSPDGVSRLSFGLYSADVSATGIRRIGLRGQEFTLHIPGASLPVTLKAFGLHNIYNALAATAAAYALGVSPAQIRAGLERFIPYAGRLNLEEVNGIVLIDDSYNANPASMRAALVTLAELKDESRGIAVLGDMLELGEETDEAHREVGRLAAVCTDRLYLLGAMAGLVAAGAGAGGLPVEQIVIADSHAAILEDLGRTVAKGDCILVKGSRALRMEIVAEGIRLGLGSRAVEKGAA